MLRVFIVSLVVAVVFSEHVKVGVIDENVKIGKDEYENEIISVELKKPNEDIKFVAQVRIHLIEGNVHINGHPLEHNTVHHIQMMVQVSDVVNGVKQVAQRKAVELRVLIEETNVNGVRRLLVEEQFVTIGQTDVEQIDVHQLIWESNVRKPIITVRLSESKINTKPKEQDHHMLIADEKSHPHKPHHGLGYGGEEGKDDDDDDDDKEHEGHHHGDRHHHHHCHHRHHNHGNSTFTKRHVHNAKCWYRSLSWKSKILLFSVGFFGLLTAVICCGLCAKRRQARRSMEVSAPMDDTIAVDDEESNVAGKDAKKVDGNKYEFHFEFDNSVVVDDKKALVEEA